ncbi:MAG: hypothetical protein R2685_16580 [Candidatus Nitrosocosmicus sp.]|jgi:hypothetical protein|nr:hypothetical protein [Candidatus Nitrosocosmicus sp.]
MSGMLTGVPSKRPPNTDVVDDTPTRTDAIMTMTTSNFTFMRIDNETNIY